MHGLNVALNLITVYNRLALVEIKFLFSLYKLINYGIFFSKLRVSDIFIGRNQQTNLFLDQPFMHQTQQIL